jgi:hypothetical protein
VAVPCGQGNGPGVRYKTGVAVPCGQGNWPGVRYKVGDFFTS